MELTKEYLKEQEKCIIENFEGYKKNIKEINTTLRLTTSKLFCKNHSQEQNPLGDRINGRKKLHDVENSDGTDGASLVRSRSLRDKNLDAQPPQAEQPVENIQTILSVGCGGFEPVYLNATHACDVHQAAGDLLKSQNWKGEFKVCSCDFLPYGFNQFDVAVCSEVIEHLPSLEIVKNTFLELDRVAKSWIVTTPNSDICKKENQYPGHLQFWNKSDIKKIIPPGILSHVKIYTRGIFIFIESPKN